MRVKTTINPVTNVLEEIPELVSVIINVIKAGLLGCVKYSLQAV